MSTNDDYLAIDMAISFESPIAMQAFINRLTGNDDDIVLAAETAMNKVLGVDSYMDGVQVHPTSKTDMQQILDDHLSARERKRRLAMAQLEIDAQISELQSKRARLVEEYS